ncbi:MAG TPA: hypothetical protein EYP10_07525, partial [Armatimonadetes bacterium]|nr:hypothetical protein [Armatimonadota bacterium]
MLEGGLASVNITPPIEVWMSGFAGRPSPAKSVHDELLVKALVLSDGESKVAIVGMDLLGLDFDIVEQVRTLVREWTGIPADALLLNTSHTHSGPSVGPLRSMGDAHQAYVQLLPAKIATAVKLACERLKPITMRYGVAEGAIGINRRERKPDGSMQLGKNPAGAIDPNVYVLRIDAGDGDTIGLVFHHAAHPVVLGASNVAISADYPGVTARALERAFGNGVLAMFLQGCCGNINALRVGGTFEECERLGRALAGVAMRAAALAEPVETMPIRVHREVVQLPLLPPPSVEEAQKLVEAHRKALQEAERANNEVKARIERGMVQWAEGVYELARSGRTDLHQPFEICVIRIGDVAFVGLSGEVFIEYAQSIQAQSPIGKTMVLGYTNGCIGYVPTAIAYSEGGYEVETAYKYYATLMI